MNALKEIMLALCGLFACFSANASAQDDQAKPDIGNRMTMSVSIPLSQPEQASPETSQKALSSREQQIENLNAQIEQMQAVLKNLKSSLPSSAPAAPASAVPKAPVLPASPPAPHAEPFRMSTANTIWLLAASAFTIWLSRKWATRNRTGKAESPPDIQQSPIRTPAARPVHGHFAGSITHKHAIKADEVDSMIEEAELYAIHGHLNNAIELLRNITLQHPSRIEAWLLLLSIFRGNVREFEVNARRFLEAVGENDAWREIQEVGRGMDPENPLYSDPEIRQHNGPDEAMQSGDKKKNRPANPPESLGSPRSISDVLVRMGAVTEPELEHVLTDFDPKRHGHCGNYLASSGLITQKQLYAALLRQLSGASQDGA